MWRHQCPAKNYYLGTKLHGVTPRHTLISTVVRTLDLKPINYEAPRYEIPLASGNFMKLLIMKFL
jgi:hypothetical protein